MNRWIALCALSIIVPGTAVAAESEEEATIEEVVVTATYRETDLMETPVSISAVTGEMVEDTGAQRMEELFTMIPGLNMVGGGNGQNGSSRYSIRGVSSQSGEIGYAPTLGPGGLYLDGTPITRHFGPAH